ncbi:hypothetical protein COT97_02730 [Candidatus Falkowbacteria bacterium CG10_big_fil_rev_8_21_14_0_10_39_11]|uniref:AAA+ ATPase domain-containing protein n=1 Tax=Candidatus Falkowbacteria bacterium CG10_big_fil_rev_8_21_14_0_10_39_11 TaxID=1974565 RepID=A0A2H0V512_9BACT|nr:MAG: hypothetical protein COT97_02730 [Candidatus Falkowbacteria bacterium CG10_big_fil_rev_8_21_14_0_10_39_11]
MPKVNKDPFPDWFRYILIRMMSRVSWQFILYGDINGLFPNGLAERAGEPDYVSLKPFLEKALRRREIVIFYNIASGMTFLRPDMETKFKKIVGMETASTDDDDPIKAARAGLQAQQGLPKDPDTCLGLLEKVLQTTSKVAVVINSVHFIAPADGGAGGMPVTERVNVERLKNWSHDLEIRNRGNVIILLTDQLSKVHNELKETGNGVCSVELTRPTADERLAFLQTITTGSARFTKYSRLRFEYETAYRSAKRGSPERQALKDQLKKVYSKLEEYPDKFAVENDFNYNEFVVATQGLSLQQILDIFIQQRSQKRPLSLTEVKKKKQEILTDEYGDIMEVINPDFGLDGIGGLEHIKKYFQLVLDGIEAGDKLMVPMGVTLMGPPGTGKTAIVEALAYDAGFNFVKTKNIRSMWVGQSESRMEKLLTGLRALAPVVVMNDEADLAEAGRNSQKGDSGVSERLMKMWMEFLSDPKIRGRVIVINCTNRPDRIDAALKRSGRSDDRILLPMPSFEERKAIFAVMFRKYKLPTNLTDFTKYANMADNLSGADIERICLAAYKLAKQSKLKSVDDASLVDAIEDFIPSASQKDIDQMTLFGLLESSSRKLIPANADEILAKIIANDLVDNLDTLLAQLYARKILPKPKTVQKTTPTADTQLMN